ncbi:hypothetical protein PQD73_gp079 [Stenotrophomonas phage Salva]|uniref:Uncharacterized protein n=1 Tax=Stenotrophomonas phage Salva TaxID=2801524 RepID=A0A8B6Q8A5_9CAUD|nr:hypothetical protein PQD73_gp079 [Stenotrophomonas phage Salva]QQM18260.1 hypothetical protein CPT_Salva_097 [Stenotrophomonas phage Salva]
MNGVHHDKLAPWEDQQIPVDPVLELKTRIANKQFEVRQRETELAQLRQELQEHNEKQFLEEYVALCNKYRARISASADREGYTDIFVEHLGEGMKMTTVSVLENEP